MTELVSVRNVDPLRGGKVELTLPDVGDGAAMALIISRPSANNRFLGPNGWQVDEHRFVPVKQTRVGADLVLAFGPELADSALRADDIVIINLSDSPYEGQAVWPNVTRSMTLDVPKPAIVPPPPPIITPPPIVPPKPVAAEKKRSALLWVVPLVAVLAIAAVAVWYFGFRPVPTPVPVAQPAAPVVSDFERGQQAFAAGECTDARAAMQKAIDGGSTQAMLFWAREQDSVDFKACLVEQVNDISALRYISMACQENPDLARQEVDALQTELQRRADGGDVMAAEVLRLAMDKTRKACGF